MMHSPLRSLHLNLARRGQEDVFAVFFKMNIKAQPRKYPEFHRNDVFANKPHVTVT